MPQANTGARSDLDTLQIKHIARLKSVWITSFWLSPLIAYTIFVIQYKLAMSLNNVTKMRHR
jgi:hypothetical protein